MTPLQWLGLVVGALGALVVLALGWRAVGAARWARRMQAQTGRLESGRFGAPGEPASVASVASEASVARFDARELDGLPAPVQRYFRQVLTDGQPIIAAARIEMAGTINMSATAEQWKPFASRQRVVTHRAGFLWDARVQLFAGVPVHVEDSYIAGQGCLMAKVCGWFTVADSQGAGEIARGEFMRYLAEAPWYPTALLPSQGVRWQAVDDAAANATLVDGSISLTLLFRFNDAGLIASVHAGSRGAGTGQDGVKQMLPWDCHLSDYQQQDGMLIPMSGEAAWVRPDGRKAYFRGQVGRLRCEYAV